MSTKPGSLPADVRQALAGGNKIEAIRLLKQKTGLGLADAKAAVESGVVPQFETDGFRDHQRLPADAMAALEAGKLLDAIRSVRAARGVGLKDAMAMILAVRRGPMAQDRPASPSRLAPGEVPRGRFGAATLISLVVALALLAWLLLKAA